MAKIQTIMNLKYTDATLKQLAQAKASDSKYLVSDGKLFGKNSAEEIVDVFKKEETQKIPPYKLFDKWGRPTLLGKLVREYELKLAKLPKSASIKDFLEQKWNQHSKGLRNLVKKVEKNFDGSYSPPRQS